MPDRNDWTTVGVRFPGSPRTYNYKAARDLGLEPGDKVLVEVEGSSRWSSAASLPRQKSVLVVEVHPEPQLVPGIPLKWIVGRDPASARQEKAV